MSSKGDSDADVDYAATSLAGMLSHFIIAYRFEIGMIAALAVLLSAFLLSIFSPFEEYTVYGEIVRIDAGGLFVNVQGFGVNVLVGTLVENPVRVSQGICFSDPSFGHSYCHIGAKVELKRMGNENGNEWWFVSAIIRGFEGNDTYVIEKTVE